MKTPIIMARFFLLLVFAGSLVPAHSEGYAQFHDPYRIKCDGYEDPDGPDDPDPPSLPPIQPPASNRLEQDVQVWIPIDINHPIGKGGVYGGLWVEPRLGNDLPELDQLIVRPSLGYRFNRHLRAAVGYDWVSTYHPDFENEHRTWQQVVLRGNIKNLSWESRNRIEQRFLPAGGTGLRVRNRVRLKYPIGKRKKWYVAAMNEVFTNINSIQNGPQAGFDQNRVFLGVGKRLSPHVDIESGYQLQYIKQPGPDQLNHIIMLSLLADFVD